MDDLWSSLPQADQDAIGVTLTSLLTRIRDRHAAKPVNVYSPDANWVDELGSVKRGANRKLFSISRVCSQTTTSTQGP